MRQRIVTLAFLLLMLAGGVRAQSGNGTGGGVEVTWHVMDDGTVIESRVTTAPVDSAQAVARRVLVRLQQEGYYQAEVDSVAIDSTRTPPVALLHVQRGPKIRIGAIQLAGAEAVPEGTLRAAMHTEPGETLAPDRLEADVQAMLALYEDAGYPLAQIRIAETTLTGDDPPALQIRIVIEEGPALRFERISVPDDVRSSPRYLAHVVDMTPGAPMTNYDPERVQERLEDTGLFRAVGTPELRVTPDGGAIVHVPLDEKAPGTFDLVLGYLPPRGSGNGQVVGNGHLRLRNLFGGGRTLSLRLDRRPGQVSEVDARGVDPYVWGTPVQVEVRFAGEQRDSTYGKQAYHLAGGYRFREGMAVVGTLVREVTKPGQAGTRLAGSAQRIARAQAWFAGLSVRYRQVDDRVNPRRGIRLDTNLERGRTVRTGQRVTAEGDTTRRQETQRQERLQAEGRLFVPSFEQQVVVLGVDARILLSDTYDRSDLFRLGGATTLRGYDEDRFLGHVVGRFLLEYRYQVDRTSYAYLFNDWGYVQTPETADLDAQRGVHAGFGLGLQFGTEIGRFNVSYALNTEDTSPANGRIHIGLSVGL